MRYHVLISEKARKQLQKLDRVTSEMIVSWIDENLNGCENPREKGKALTGPLKGIWRYRIEDYRILAEIRDGEVVILIIEVRHRKNVYEKKNVYD